MIKKKGMHNSSLLISTGSELYAGISRQSANASWMGHFRNDNLLLTVKGEGILILDSHKYELSPGMLIYLAPNFQRQFQTFTEWEAIWVHFNLSECGNIHPKWSTLEQCQLCHTTSSETKILQWNLLQICQVISERRIGWNRLVYLLISEVIMRGNMNAESRMPSPHIELAAKLLNKPGNKMSMDEIASRCMMSRASFYTKFRETFGMSPQRYRENELIRQCRYLLECTTLSLKQIALKLKIDDYFYLSHRFKKWCHVSPTEYRRRIKNSR